MTDIIPLTVICYGEVLWDALPDGPQPGGAPLNVAYHLTRLGIDSGIVSRIGDDMNGKNLQRLLNKWGINSKMLQLDVENPTSEVIAKMNNGNEITYEILFPVAWDFISYNEQTALQIKGAKYFVYGSLASRNDLARQSLLQLLQTDAVKVFDINLRPPFFNRDLLELLLEKADIVKFNEAELEMAQTFFGGPLDSEASQIKFIQRRFNIPEIIVTKGEFGASYYKGSQVYNAWGTEVKVVDTIGSGDSFLAAFIANHSQKNNPQATIKNAVAMGAFIATKKGGCPQYNLSEYDQFKNQIF